MTRNAGGADCRLAVDEYEVMLDGSASSPRELAEALLSGRPGPIRMADGSGAVSVRRTESPRLKTAIEQGPMLVFEGNDDAIRLIVETIRSVANAGAESERGPVRRHAHFEFLGEDDDWRDADSVALVITADWPDAAT